jgi:hypothetical protein
MLAEKKGKRIMNEKVNRLFKTQKYIPNAIYVLLCLLIPMGEAVAQAVPQLTAISPRGAQRGMTFEITLQGKNIKGATALLFSGEGASGQIKAMKRQAAAVFSGSGVSGNIPDESRLVAEVAIAGDAPLGEQRLRLVTPKGVSNAQRFIIEDLVQLDEMEPNSTAAEANPVSFPVTVSGKIESVEDTDFFRFEAKPGQRILCDVNASRIGSPLDSFLILFGLDGKEVASNDIANGLDSQLDYTIPKNAEGTYTLQIRDLRYKGGADFTYRLSIGELPCLDSIFPLGGRRGMETTIALEGRNLGVESMQISIAPDAPLGMQEVRVMTPSGLATNPHPFVVGNLPEITETESENMADKVTAVTPPVTINGRIGSAGDIDKFSFTAKKGQRLIFDVNARRLGSPLDSLLVLTDAEGKELMVNDDAAGSEAQIDFTFEADGKYQVAVHDLNTQGGSEFTYRLSIRPLQPDFRVTLIQTDPNDPRRGMIPLDNPRISRGSSTFLTVQVNRIDGFDGSLRFTIPDLPKDFTVSPAIIGASQAQTLITVTASPDAAPGLLPITVVGMGAIGNQRVERKATPNPIYLTVMDAPAFRLEIVQVNATVMQSKSAELDIRATRSNGFVGPIALSVVGLPPRVTTNNPTIPEGKTEAKLTISAGSFAGRELIPVLSPVLTQDIVVNGTATINNEPVTQSTGAFSLTITEVPFVLAVEPVRVSLVLPTVPVASGTEGNAIAANASDTTQSNAPASPPNKTVEAIFTVNATRQGGFTDKIYITPSGLPEKGLRLLTEDIRIVDHQTETKVTLETTAEVEPGTYTFKFIGKATVNGREFDVESPTVTVKVIGGTPIASTESP